MTEIEDARGTGGSERVDTLTRGWTLGAGREHVAAAARVALAGPPAPRPRADLIVAGKYRLSHQIGDGGMGEVWRARHLSLDAEVAVKFTRPELLDDSARLRLSHEARVLARLDHPSIVRVLDFGTAEDDSPYMVLELLRGSSLRDTLSARARLSPAAAARILLPVAGAVAAAHAEGIVHRDLKPDNVILVRGASGAITPKVLDFGIAKWRAQPVDGFATREGTLIGSPDYMAPEQAAGGVEVDARTDVWAFCVLFYELVTGRHPFARMTLTDTLHAILHESVPPIAPADGPDPTLATIIARGLAKHPDHRWQSMEELGSRLAAWAMEQGIREDSTGGSIHARWLSGGSRPLSDAPRVVITPPPPRERPAVLPLVSIPPPSPSPRSRFGRVALAVLPVLAIGLLVAGVALVTGVEAPRRAASDAAQAK